MTWHRSGLILFAALLTWSCSKSTKGGPEAAVSSATSVPRQAGLYAKGDEVRTEWQGEWYDSTIVAVEGDRYRVHYHGFPESDDEWVDAKRLRKKVECPPCPEGSKNEVKPGCPCPVAAASLPLPPGTKVVKREDRIGHHGSSTSGRWALSPEPMEKVAGYYRALSEATEESPRLFTLSNGWKVELAPPEPVPEASGRPVVNDAPSAGTWIILSRFSPPPPCPPCPKGQVIVSSSTCGCGKPPVGSSVGAPTKKYSGGNKPKKGTKVLTEWQGRWWPATVTAVDGKRFRVHYDGFPTTDDEWVDIGRLAPRPAEPRDAGS